MPKLLEEFEICLWPSVYEQEAKSIQKNMAHILVIFMLALNA